MANDGSIDERLRFAIANKRLLQVHYDDAIRIVEPHDYGVLNNTEKLFAYQRRNLTRPMKERDTHWRLLELSKIEECVVLDETSPAVVETTTRNISRGKSSTPASVNSRPRAQCHTAVLEEDAMPTLIWIASALAAGVLARFVMKSRGFGFTGDAVLGVLGSVSGAWLLRFVGGEVSPGGIAHIATAFVGAICVVAVGRLALRVAQGASQLSEATVGATLPDIETQIRRLSDLEKKVLTRVLRKQGLPRDPTETFRQHLSLGDRVADRVAIFGGSWTFLGCFAAFMLAWMFLNTATSRPADPYPFILLNLILSCLAAVQAPVIMMSQNRQAARDRFDAQQDYQVNVRAEMQISELHVKLDEARNVDWQAVIALQRQQLEVLERIQRSLNEK